MKRKNYCSSTRLKTCRQLLQESVKNAEFIVYGNPQSLKYALFGFFYFLFSQIGRQAMQGFFKCLLN